MQKKKLPKTAAAEVAGHKRRSHAAKRKRRTAEDILNRIVRAAREEFKRSGFSRTTTATIARKADVTEAQLFRYFESKSNLFRETIFKPLDQHFSTFINEHLLDSADTAGTREKSNIYIAELQRFIRENSEMFASLIVTQIYDSGTAHSVGKINSLGAYFDHGATRMTKRIKGKPRIDPRLMVRLAFVSVLASVVFRDWIFPAGLASDEEIEAAITAFVMEGVGANANRS